MTSDNGAGLAQSQAVHLCRLFSAAGVRFWLGGGWGVDALAGRQTRVHRDLDLLVDARDEARLLEVLEADGYAVETDWRPNRVELAKAGAGWVDVHPVDFDASGHGVLQGLNGVVYHFPPEALTTGRIADLDVGCVTAARQRAARDGYELRPQDRHDLEVLAGLP